LKLVKNPDITTSRFTDKPIAKLQQCNYVALVDIGANNAPPNSQIEHKSAKQSLVMPSVRNTKLPL